MLLHLRVQRGIGQGRRSHGTVPEEGGRPPERRTEKAAEAPAPVAVGLARGTSGGGEETEAPQPIGGCPRAS
eukprot:9499371-Pyramimonas_sp.AAC.1